MTKKKKELTLLNLESLEKVAECLKTLSHPHRLRIIQILLQDNYSVGELAEACNIPSHVASEHLRLLKDRGFLKSRREGRRIYYYIVEKTLSQLMACFQKRYGTSC